MQDKPGSWDGWQWESLSLARQFALAGGTVMLVAILAVGLWVAGRIESIVVRNTANTTSLYMESFVAPLLQDLSQGGDLSSASRLEVAALLEQTALGQRVVSFKLWNEQGFVIDASNASLEGQQFPLSENLRLAWAGDVRADLGQTGDEEDLAEGALGVPLLEIYAPIRDAKTGEVIAVAEFYELASDLASDLITARLASWGAVTAVMVAIGLSLFAIVLRGSFTIDRQISELKSLSARNLALRIRAQGAAGRVAALNDATLKQIGADLHDGPAQHLGFAALRLDSLRGLTTDARAQAEVDAVEQAVRESIKEIRSIARGLSLPDIERRTVTDLLQSLALGHAERSGSPVDCAFDLPEGTLLSAAVKTCVYRVAQEGLTNAWRHGGGIAQELYLELAGDLLTLAVRDGGPGLPPGAEPASVTAVSGMGLSGMTDRVESLGGRIEARNRRGGGAELVMTLDLKGAE